ncbi:MAG TPA: hypothetical protein VK525_13715 [Candidatus Saccharimonadales bacterium]|nr:hypothetical protein [Candidatus Saccharimonadales bacterium]
MNAGKESFAIAWSSYVQLHGRFLVNSLITDAARLTVMTGWTARLQR